MRRQDDVHSQPKAASRGRICHLRMFPHFRHIDFQTSWFWVSVLFLRTSFFPEWAQIFRRNFKRMISKGGHNRSSSGSSRRSEYQIHLHTPSKDWIDLKVKSGKPHRSRSYKGTGNGGSVNSHSLVHSRTESGVAILSDPGRPGSVRLGSSRPGTPESSGPGTRHDRSKKVSVDYLLAMRRLESGRRNEVQEYPGVQANQITRLTGEDESVRSIY